MNLPIHHPQLSKTQWLDDYKKLSTLYQLKERNLIQTFLKDDYHLSKIYTTLLKTDILSEQKSFTDTEKQLKLFIHEAHSYFQSNTLSKATTNNIHTKVKKIDELLLKTRKDFKTKFESLLIEEDLLEKELQEYESKFITYFPSSSPSDNISLTNTNNNTILNTEQQQQQLSTLSINKIDTITLYIQNIITSPTIIIDTLTPSFSDIETIVKRCAYAQLSQLKEKVELIDNIIDKKLGGVTLTWQLKEHEDFLKVKNIHNNKINTYEFLTELANTIPYLPSSELKTHIKLYDKYSHLNEVKTLLLRRYRELKIEKEEQEKQKVMERLRLEKEKFNTKQRDKQHMQQELEEKKQKVREWKQMKEKQNTEMLKLKQEQERKVKEKERKQYMLIKARNQDLLSEYKKRKEYETYCKQQQQHLTTQVVDPIDMERIKEKEEELLEKKRNVVLAKSSKQLPYETTYARYKLNHNKKYSNINNKLNELTTGSRNKQRHNFNPQTDQAKDACTMANNILGHVSRGVPAWRKGM